MCGDGAGDTTHAFGVRDPGPLWWDTNMSLSKTLSCSRGMQTLTYSNCKVLWIKASNKCYVNVAVREINMLKIYRLYLIPLNISHINLVEFEVLKLLLKYNWNSIETIKYIFKKKIEMTKTYNKITKTLTKIKMLNFQSIVSRLMQK